MSLFGVGQDARSSEPLADKNCYEERRREHEHDNLRQPLGQSIDRNCAELEAPESLDEAVALSRTLQPSIIVDIRYGQPDLVEETRLRIARMCEATDQDIITSARAFVEWGRRLNYDESLIPPVRCKEVSTGR